VPGERLEVFGRGSVGSGQREGGHHDAVPFVLACGRSSTTRVRPEEALAMKKDQAYAEFKAYWQIADELLEKATKEQLSTVARLLALQSAHGCPG
jgi:hypothetical protein